jgi:carboxypeptidase C (cathepsin A)
LKRALGKDPALKVFIASGYFDLATPYLSSDYTVSHMLLEPKLRKNFVFARYHGGHAMYEDEKVRPQLRKDAEAFILGAFAAHRGDQHTK